MFSGMKTFNYFCFPTTRIVRNQKRYFYSPIFILYTHSVIPLIYQLLSAARNFNKNHNNEGRLSSLSIGLAGEKRPIYISEHLPVSSRKLFFAAKEFAKLHKYEFCWSTNGNIFVRKSTGAKQILIKSELTLRALEPQ